MARNDTHIEQNRESEQETKNVKGNNSYKVVIVWGNVFQFIVIHLTALYGLYVLCTEWSLPLYIYGHVLMMCATLGVTGGAHRLWSHSAYKAKWQMRVMLMLFQTLAFQNSIFEWARDHRMHHKYVDTDCDPHNANRGFFFSHIGWLMVKKHPDIKAKGKSIDLSDLYADPIVMFQKKYYMILVPLICFILPTLVPYYMGYSFRQSFFICTMLRYCLSLHATWFINSVAHLWGLKPYDKNIKPTESKFVMLVTLGEGYHNYHHVFSWDYKAAEFGSHFYNFTKTVIDLCAKIGWAYDLKTVSDDMIRKRIIRTGDGSHAVSLKHKKTEALMRELDHEKEEKLSWGWNDKNMLESDRNDAIIINKK